MITVLYFARLKESLGIGKEEVALSGVVDVEGLRQLLAGRGGVWAEEFAGARMMRAAVNLDMARGDTVVKDGDEVAFFPPVTGG
jgi:sulfur-carrier protein